eukprot:18542-Heterococcus_DN1.PRE.2
MAVRTPMCYSCATHIILWVATCSDYHRDSYTDCESTHLVYAYAVQIAPHSRGACHDASSLGAHVACTLEVTHHWATVAAAVTSMFNKRTWSSVEQQCIVSS